MKYKVKVPQEYAFCSDQYSFRTFDTNNIVYTDNCVVFEPIRPDDNYISSWPVRIVVPENLCIIFHMMK